MGSTYNRCDCLCYPIELLAQNPGLIQSVSQAFLPVLRAWVEVGGIAPSQCSKASLPQPILI
jgi:hypothetical protein